MEALIGIVLLVLISLFSVFYAYFKHCHEYWNSRGIPHDKPSIPYGNIKGLGKTINFGIFSQNLYNKYKPTGAKLCGAYFINRPVAILLDLELVKNVMVRDFTNFDERGLYYNEKDDPLSAHLFSLNGEKWRKLRAKLTPTFTSGKMKFMFPTVVDVAERFRVCLHDVIKEQDELEMKELLARFTTDVIGTCAFGIECNSLKDPNAEFRHYGRLSFTKRRHGMFFSILTNGFKNTARKLRIKNISDDVATFFMKVVCDTVDYREKNNVRRNDFMDLLIDLKNQETSDKEKRITLNEIAAQAFVFFLAGFETSSTTLTFCLYELALNPEIQTKARRIVQEAYKKYDGKFTYEMMLDMPFIDQVLEETLRKWPPVTILNRVAKNDYPISGTKITIEKEISIHIPVLGIHYNPEYYPDPEKFDPDRFTSDEKKKRDTITWLPFGDGPRNCIGLRFGMMQARIGLVTLLNNFEFSFGPNATVPLVIEEKSFILSPKGGMYLKLKPIESQIKKS